MKYFLAGILTTLVALLIGGYLALQSGKIPANADGTPSRLELWMARTSLRATLRHQAPRESDPIPLTTANLVTGVRIFGNHCALCHGTSRGTASASPVAKGEYPRPPQLASDGVEDDPTGYSFWKIKHGIRLTGMPSFSNALTDQQIWTVALFLKHMNKLPPAAEDAWLQIKN
ncbi:MAG: c-type cytochrome [Acidiferrobacterales bacterium]